MLKLDFIQTLAFAGLVLFAGHGIRRLIPPLARYNIPAPVVGGLLVAGITLICRRWDATLFQFDPLLQTPLMIAFFASVGFGASFSLLKKGGPVVVLFLVIATVVAVLQNVVGILVALPLGQHPLLGVLAGSVTLTGGPATGLAFAPLFEQAGVHGAATVAVAAAMVGIVTGGLVGGPIGTLLIERHGVVGRRRTGSAGLPATAEQAVERLVPEPADSAPEREDAEAYRLLKTLVAFLVAMGIGSWVSQGFDALGITLPATIGALIVAALIRLLDDLTGVVRLSHRTVDDIGNVALSLFLVLALMTLRLWELAGLAGPLAVILLCQVVLIAALAYWLIYRLMGRDYDAAVMSGGFCGFMLGTTANAMANMEALVQRYGSSPKSFLVVPMVGAFFIDFTNVLIITAFLNFWR